MRLRIHRGTKEIGGTCIEVEAQGKRIALDVGLPLDAPDDGQEELLPEVPGFREPDDSLLGVVISHPHQDHYGLARHIRPEVPIWIGKAANHIMTAASAYVPGGHAFASPRFIADRTPVQIGPFRITPYLVDHSAFDAYALLVEADGKRVFYSGDFRAHGRKKALFEAMVNRPPGNLDVLLMEGTTIGRAGTSEGFATETDLEREFVQTFRETAGILLTDGGPTMRTLRKLVIAAAVVVGLLSVSATQAEPASARVPTKCADLFIEAGNWNDRMVRATEEMRQLIDGQLDYVTRPWRPATRIELWYLADQFYQYPAGFMLVSIEKALGCAAETTRECHPFYAQVAVDKLRAERRLEAVRDYLMSFPLSYSDTLVTRQQIIRFAEVYTQALEPLLEHQHSTMAAVRCIAPQQ